MYYNPIYLYLYSMCKSTALAEDLAQETFLKAILSLDDKHQNVKAWLFTVARNLFFNYSKKKRATVSMDELVNREDTTVPTPVAKLIEDEQKQNLLRAMDRLSATKKQILTLQYFGGLSQKEIADLLKLSPSCVRVQAMRAKNDLKKYLEVQDYDHS